MIHESPSGAPIMKALVIEHDWGTLNPGDTLSIEIVPFNAVGAEVAFPYDPCPISPMPVGTSTICVCGNAEGAPVALLQASNSTGFPIVVGVKKYAILFYDLHLMT